MLATLTAIDPLYAGCMKPLSIISEDDSNHKILVDSEKELIRFDDVAAQHKAVRGYSRQFCSNDALYIDAETNLFFFEFKSGKAKAEEVKSKAVDSLLIAMDMGIISSFSDAKQRLEYALVTDHAYLQQLNNHVRREKFKLPAGLESLRWLFKMVHAYTPEQFERLILPKI